MTTINSTGAAARMLAKGVDPGADCLHEVATAIRNGLPVLVNSTTALLEWNHTPANLRHPGELPPGPDFPMYFTCGNTGDVCLSTISAEMVCVDTKNGVYHKGTIGLQTVAQREKQLNGRYMGYTEAISGYTINNTPLITANQRLVGITNTRVRDVPFTTGTVLELLGINTIVDVDGYTTAGTLADGTTNWYHITSPKNGWIDSALIKGGLTTEGLTNMTPSGPPVVIPPIITPPVIVPPITSPVVNPPTNTPVTTPPVTGPVTTPPVVVPPKESDPPVTATPIVNFNPDEANAVGTDLGDVANASLTPKGRAKLYTIMTRINGISAPAIVAGGAAAAFVRGQIGLDILIGVGVATVINNIVTSFTTKLAKNNVNK